MSCKGKRCPRPAMGFSADIASLIHQCRRRADGDRDAEQLSTEYRVQYSTYVTSHP